MIFPRGPNPGSEPTSTSKSPSGFVPETHAVCSMPTRDRYSKIGKINVCLLFQVLAWVVNTVKGVKGGAALAEDAEPLIRNTFSLPIWGCVGPTVGPTVSSI